MALTTIVLRGGYDGNSVVGPLDAVPDGFPEETTAYDYSDDSDLDDDEGDDDGRHTSAGPSNNAEGSEPGVCSFTSYPFVLSHPNLPTGSLRVPRSRSKLQNLPSLPSLGWEQQGKPS